MSNQGTASTSQALDDANAQSPYEIEYLFADSDPTESSGPCTQILVTRRTTPLSYDDWCVHVRLAGEPWSLLGFVDAARMRDGGTTTMQGRDIKIYSPSPFKKSEKPYWLHKEGLLQEIRAMENEKDPDAYDESYERKSLVCLSRPECLEGAEHVAMCDFYVNHRQNRLDEERQLLD